MACATLVCAGLASTLQAQAAARPQPTCVRNVTLESGSETRHTILLRDGRIEAILAAEAPTPPGMRVVDGEGLLCLPAFVDAFTKTGYTASEPVKDQDVPVDVGSDVRIDMRLANRKGIQPAFRAVEALSIETGDSEAWREAGFGAAHVAPAGQLLAGTSCIAATREAAMRDLVLRPEVFASATFQAPGSGYPSTLMGYIAQLRQFFLDAQRHAELVRRFEQGRPGPRPPFDAELEAGSAILAGERVVLCEVESHRDVERWIKLADEFGFRLAFAGGRDAWRVSDTLVERNLPVVLTLGWGKEVDDPRADDEEEEEAPTEGEESADPEAGAPAASEPAEEQAADAEAPEVDEDEEEVVWEYDEPLAVRIARRLKWEEQRDSALRLHEAGVPIAFGSADDKPGKLLGKVRTLIEEGLPAEAALAALTQNAADLLGVGDRLGAVRAGRDATLVLWSDDPLTNKKAKPVWVFVDGFPTEYDLPEEDAGDGGAPAEGVTASGVWNLAVESEDGTNEVQLELEMAEDGAIEGVMHFENPMDSSAMQAPVSGHLSGTDVTLSALLEFGEFEMELACELSIDGDEMSGEFVYTAEFFPDGMVRSAEGLREPERARAHVEESSHSHSGPHADAR